jgi:glycosyltransferase involved in cell wall biosynthesis
MISVAMCTFNGEKYLCEQINSILLQTLVPDEIVICDDGSTDGTKEILKAFARCHPFIKAHFNPSNLGCTKNFEQAIRKCKGDLIFLADQDDVWLPEKVATITNEFERRPKVKMFFTDAYVANEQLTPEPESLWDTLYFEPQKFTKGIIFRQNLVTGATMAFRKEALTLSFPFPAAVVHDDWLAYTIAVRYPVGLIEKKLIYYRQHHGQQVGAEFGRRHKSLIGNIKRVLVRNFRRGRLLIINYIENN